MSPLSIIGPLTSLFSALGTFIASPMGQLTMGMTAMALTAPGGAPPMYVPGAAPTATAEMPTRQAGAVREAQRDFLYKESTRAGRRSTILTGAQGLEAEPVLGQAALLGARA